MVMISYIGIRDFASEEKDVIKKISEEFAEKFDLVDSNGTLKVEVKKYNSTGTVAKYAVNLMFDSVTVVQNVKQDDWELKRALRKTFENMSNALSKMDKQAAKKTPKTFT
ncbi:MAG: hypothetical protein ABIF40_00965 [archaeon]